MFGRLPEEHLTSLHNRTNHSFRRTHSGCAGQSGKLGETNTRFCSRFGTWVLQLVLGHNDAAKTHAAAYITLLLLRKNKRYPAIIFQVLTVCFLHRGSSSKGVKRAPNNNNNNNKTNPTVTAQISSKVHLPPSEAEPAKGPQLAVILLLGLDGAGKTTLLGTLQGEHDPKVRPSVGFKPTTMMLSDQLKVTPKAVGRGQTGWGGAGAHENKTKQKITRTLLPPLCTKL